MSCVVMLAEQGQLPEKHKEAMQSVTGQSNDTEHTCIGGAIRGKSEKAGRKAGSVQSIENRGFYETKEEKRQFICESFQLDTKAILNTADAKLKEAVIKLFSDNFEVLASHPIMLKLKC